MKAERQSISRQVNFCLSWILMRGGAIVPFASFHAGIYCNEYSQLATCICLSWIFTIFDWSMYILTDRMLQINSIYPTVL